MNERQTVGKMNERDSVKNERQSGENEREREEKGCVLMKLGRNIIKSRHPPPPTKKKPSQNLLSKSLSNLTLETLT